MTYYKGINKRIQIETKSKGGKQEESIACLAELTTPDHSNLIELHPALGNALSSVTYSTSRGILLTRLQGTAFQNFYLPIINPNTLLLSNNKKK